MYNVLTNIDEFLRKFKERFEEVKACNNLRIRDYRIQALMTDIERAFDIPVADRAKREAFKVGFPEVWDLYQRVSKERWPNQ
ncbi:hypothetical protein SAMN05421839_10643 [Halolactibacillus halophilus]|uniref:Uncharacterized protein n=2 Tax=Halolactibacillus halophilus TaxID=306540 RepID=A0A1I5MQC8_9BACI|nr:hypothetical protein [Halolactibacillus halophilus]GEM02888.1 hypothetical protein HHA03_24200 [Halolactibacillus halophilus]SFP11507.1 hypothetical protein SAMN05421839_10643 [Halolactibacillus halophilus]